ncbi:MAG: ATP-binding protein [Pseudomonadota bacterium]
MTGGPGFRWRILASMLLSALLAVGILASKQLYFSSVVANAEGLIELTGLERLVADAPPADLPGPLAQWEPVTLPDDWMQSGYPNGVAWYRYRLDLNVPPGRLWGILLKRVNLNAAVYLNGRLVGQIGAMASPISRNWARALLYSIPSGLMHEGRNELKIKVICHPAGHGMLGRMLMGPRELLVPAERRSQFFNLEVPRFVVALSAMMGLVIGGIWLLRRRDTEYGWFALISGCAAAHSLKYFVTDTGLNEYTWDWFQFMTFTGISFALYFFLMRYRDVRVRRADQLMAAAWTAIAVVLSVLAALRSPQLYDVAMLAVLLAFGSNLYAMSHVLRQLLVTRSAEIYWITLCIVFLLVTVTFDLAQVFGFVARTPGEVSVYFLPLFLATFGGIMLFRFVTAIRERDQLMVDLEGRVAVAAERIVTLEKERALAQQREAIMRDMHDGVGGHLVSSLALLERQPEADLVLKDVLRGALTDLRLMIDSLDADSGDLGFLLGSLRDRMDPVLERSGFEVIWALEPVPSVGAISPHHALQIMRILQEALTNAIKHAQAGRLRIAMQATADGEAICCTVEDDGSGFAAAAVRRGRGLLNMERRATAVGATLTVGPALCFAASGPAAGSGTRVQLRLPLTSFGRY